GWQQLGTWTVTAGSQLGSISPSTAIAGSGPTTLTANGSGFVGGASIRWTPANGSTAVLPATLVSSNQLQATVPASLLATAGTAQVAVASGGNITQSQTFTITASPEVASAVSVTPNSGSGASQAFQFLYSDSNGASALRTVWVYITSNFSSPVTNRCQIYYDPVANVLKLRNDAGTAWIAGTPGTTAILQTSQCSIGLNAVTASTSVGNLTLTVPVTFSDSFTGAKQIWMYAGGTTVNGGWQQLGAWTH